MESRLAALEATLAPGVPTAEISRRPVVHCAIGREIYPFIQGYIMKSPLIVACVYHVTNRLILNDLATREGVCVLTMPLTQHGTYMTLHPADRSGTSGACTSSGPDWKRLRPIGDSGPVRYIRYDANTTAHGQVALMHHKFLIGLTSDRAPEWVITGSFNFTRPAAEVHDENVIYTDEPQVVGRYFLEFNRLYNMSMPP